MQNPVRETQTLLHSGNPFLKSIEMAEDYTMTWIVSFLTNLHAVSIGVCKFGLYFSTSKSSPSAFRSRWITNYESLRHCSIFICSAY